MGIMMVEQKTSDKSVLSLIYLNFYIITLRMKVHEYHLVFAVDSRAGPRVEQF